MRNTYANVKEVERSRETVTRRNKRDPPNLENNAITLFHKQFFEGPSFNCVSCQRLLYRSSVSRLNMKNYVNIQEDLLSSCITSIKSHDGLQYICSCCKSSILKGTIPSISVANGLEFDEIPNELKDLKSLEAVFISQRIPFMKLVALPRGKQKSVHGCVVNIPIEIQQSLSVLPRVPSSDSFITVKLKRKIKYRGHVFMQTIRPRKIKNALHNLKCVMKNPLYEDVILNDK